MRKLKELRELHSMLGEGILNEVEFVEQKTIVSGIIAETSVTVCIIIIIISSRHDFLWFRLIIIFTTITILCYYHQLQYYSITNDYYTL